MSRLHIWTLAHLNSALQGLAVVAEDSCVCLSLFRLPGNKPVITKETDQIVRFLICLVIFIPVSETTFKYFKEKILLFYLNELQTGHNMNINSFPDDCLRLVLRRSPLIELVHLRCICSRWKGLIEEMFFEHKHSLKIFGSKYDMRHFGEVVGNHRINEHIDLKLRSDGKYIFI